MIGKILLLAFLVTGCATAGGPPGGVDDTEVLSSAPLDERPWFRGLLCALGIGLDVGSAVTGGVSSTTGSGVTGLCQ